MAESVTVEACSRYSLRQVLGALDYPSSALLQCCDLNTAPARKLPFQLGNVKLS